jgi:acyl-CoA synthetase (AMP-forming)/AMP-acid ligase II
VTLRNPDYLLSQLLLTAAEKYPDRPALIFPDARLTYAQLSELSQRYARAMVGHGLSRGDHVGILAVNRLEYIALLFGCMFSGTVAVLLNARFRVQELQHAATHCDLKWIFVGQNEGVPHAARLLEALPELANADASGTVSVPAAPMLERVVTLDAFDQAGFTAFSDFLAEETLATPAQFDARQEAVIASEPALIMFTSGTTSLPKGCMLTQESVFRTSLAMTRYPCSTWRLFCRC